MMHLHSLGQCMISLGAARLLPTARLMFAGALYVAVEGSRSIGREQMAGLLWPDLSEERATHALRQVLYKLRAQGVMLDGDADRVTLPAGAVTTDYDDLLAPSASCPVNEMLTRIPGGFLPGYVPTVSRPFAEWVEAHRERVNSVLRRQLVSGISALRGAGDWPATQALAQRCLELDPLNEEATLAFAEAMAMDGSKARAIMIIDRYMNEIGPRARELHLPATMLRKRISELYPLPPVIERDPPHTGREVEMEKLDAALKDARQGRGSAFVISGPPGIGKTRLVTEFTRAAQLQGLRIARSSMGQHDDHRPLGAWSDLVPLMQRMPGALGCDPESLPYLTRLTTYDSKQTTPSPETQDAEYLFARIRLAILDLVAAVASESCVILLIEDVHWMDEWSWDVMSALTKRLEKIGVLILMTRRDGDAVATSVPTDAVLYGMPLGPLDDARCRKLLGAVGPGSRITDEEFVEWCVRTCGGNPYFLIELGRRASKTDGRFQAPPSLTRLIAERFLDVAPLSRRLLQAAAVLGKNSTLARIERVLDERRVSLLDSLDELVRHSLILSDGERVICRHDLLGMSALSEISALALTLLHRHAAMALGDEINDASTPAHLWDCAQHWEAAGERVQAIMLLKRCVARAMEMGAPAEAARMLDHALAWHHSREERAGCQRELIRVLSLTREYPRLLEVCAELAATTGQKNASGESHTREELAELDALESSRGATFEGLDRAVECASAEDASADHRVEAAIIACKISSNLFSPEKARLAFNAASPIITQAQPALGIELRVVYEGSFGTAAACAEAAGELRTLVIHPPMDIRCIHALKLCALGFYVNGQIEDAISSATDDVLACEALQMPSAIQSAYQILARIHLGLGDLEAASLAIEREGRTDVRQSPMTSTVRLEHAARLALLRGDYTRAAILLRDLYSQWTPRWARAIVHHQGLKCLLRLRSENWCPTDEDLSQLLAMHQHARTFAFHDFFVYMLCFALAARGEPDAALPLIEDYVAQYRFERGPILRQLSDYIRALRN